MIATLTRHQIGTVERALAIFQQLGLVEQLDCGLLYMTDIELMIGHFGMVALKNMLYCTTSKTFSGIFNFTVKLCQMLCQCTGRIH